MHKAAMMLGRSALVLKEAEINEEGPCYVKIRARKAGLLAWFFTLLGIDTTTTFEVYENRVEFSQGSLSGKFKEMIPMSSISNLGTGYMKPFILLLLATISGLYCFCGLLVCLFANVPDSNIIPVLISLLFTLVFGVCYALRKSMVIYAIPDSGRGAVVAFKSSIIEGVYLSEEKAYRIINLMNELVEQSKAK